MSISQLSTLESTEHDVQKQFNEDDRWGMRDDQEILKAGMKVIDAHIQKIKNDLHIDCTPGTLVKLESLSSEFNDEQKKMTSMKLLTENKQKIHEVAQRIYQAEKDDLAIT